MRTRIVAAGLASGLAVIAGAPLMGQGGAVTFKDVTAAPESRSSTTAAAPGKKYLPETMGAGGAFVDLDGDGWLDLVIVNGRDWAPKAGTASVHGLYRNNRNGTFTDVVKGSGLDQPAYGMGVAAGDVDNDGDEDLYITALEGDRLYRNDGAFKFTNVTKAAGIVNANFGTSAAFVDYDRDGRLDLFVANYVKWSEATDKRCALDGKNKSYCTPEVYPGVASKLFRNLGAGRFADVSQKAGVANPGAKALGVGLSTTTATAGSTCLSPTTRNPISCFHNNRNGTFTDTAVAAGVAFSDDGVARGAMGVDAADYDRSGRPHLLVSNFQNQMLALYRNEGGGLFGDVAPASPVGRVSMATLGFGAFFFDYDLDGWIDVFATNGHIEESVTDRAAEGPVQAAAAAVPQRGQGPLRACVADGRPGLRRASGGARRRLRRLRSRRRSGRAAGQQPRAGPAAAQRRRQPQQLGLGPGVRHEGQSQRHRRRRARHQRAGHAVADGPQRVELLLAERPCGDLRSRQRHRRHVDRGRVAGRREGDREERAGQDVREDRRRQRTRVGTRLTTVRGSRRVATMRAIVRLTSWSCNRASFVAPAT